MSDPRRRKELAKIHLAKKALALDDGSYRALLSRVAGVESSKDLDQAGRTKVLDEFKRLGFDDRRIKRAGTRPLAEGAEASKMRALWLALFQLGEVHDGSEAALAKYAERMTGKAALQWLTQRDVAKVINTLRAWAERVGLRQPNSFDLSVINGHRRVAMLEEADMGFAAKCELILVLWDRARHIVGPFEAWLQANHGVQKRWALSNDAADAAIATLGSIVRRDRKQRERAQRP